MRIIHMLVIRVAVNLGLHYNIKTSYSNLGLNYRNKHAPSLFILVWLRVRMAKVILNIQ